MRDRLDQRSAADHEEQEKLRYRDSAGDVRGGRQGRMSSSGAASG